jgi:hypothetical protein
MQKIVKKNTFNKAKENGVKIKLPLVCIFAMNLAKNWHT